MPPPRIKLPAAALARWHQPASRSTAASILTSSLRPLSASTLAGSTSPSGPVRGKSSKASAPAKEADQDDDFEIGLPEKPTSKWLSNLRTALGRCIMEGCAAGPEVERAAAIARVLGTEWRSLTAGCDGFLTSTPTRASGGLEGQRVVWGEMDSFQHVNNVNYIRYAESARVNWMRRFAYADGGADPERRAAWLELMQPKAVGLILKSIKAEYKFPMTYPDRISVYHKLRHQPSPPGSSSDSSSLVLDAVVISHAHARVACRIEEDVATYDYRRPGVAPIPEFARSALREHWLAQKAEARRARNRVRELSRMVEDLQRDTC